MYFFYRPKVELQRARNAQDVQRLYFLLSPERSVGHPIGAAPRKRRGNLDLAGSDLHRLFIMTSKKMPEHGNRSRNWGAKARLLKHVLWL
jgi:hypothetical protein